MVRACGLLPSLSILFLLGAAGLPLGRAGAQAAGAPSAEAVKPSAFLLAGPLPWPAAVFGKAPSRSGLDLERLEPREKETLSWLGKSYPWQVVDAKAGNLALPRGKKGDLVYLAVYLENPRWQEITFRWSWPGRAGFYLDGKKAGETRAGEGKSTRPLARGRWKILFRLVLSGGKGETFAFSARPGGVKKPYPPGFQVAPRHLPARFEEIQRRRRAGRPVLSPGGTRLAYTFKGNLYVVDLPPAKGRRIYPAGKMVPIRFLDEKKLACLDGGDLKFLDLESGRARTALKGLAHAGNLRFSPGGDRLFWLESPPKPKPKPVTRFTELRQKLVDWNPGCRIWTADLEKGLRRPVTATGDFQVTSFDLDPKGERLLLVKKTPIPYRPWFTSELWLVDARTFQSRKAAVLQTGFESWPSDLSFSPGGDRVLFIAPASEVWPPDDPRAKKQKPHPGAPAWLSESHGEHNFDNEDLYLLDLKSGKVKNLTAGFDPAVVSGTRPWWSPGGKKVHFLATAGRRRALYTLDLSVDPPAVKAWPAGPLVMDALSPAPAAAPPRVAFFGGGFTRLPYIAWMEKGSAPREVFDPNKELLAEWKLSAPVDFAFLNKEGVRIDGWLYPALDPLPGKIPLVVYYYGGASATRELFYWTHQFLAANGYAVYVLNPRGAGAYGRDFADSHVNDWGKRASADILEGIGRVLKAHPELDPAKVGCFGGSYGGFTTMDLVTKDANLAAAVSMYGISNIASYWGGGTWGWTYGDMALARSYPWNRRDIFVDRSPLFHADRIKTPLLLLHGLADVNVPCLESQQMFTALKVLGRKVELVTFQGEDHGISGSRKDRNLHRTMILEWFDRFLKGQPEAWNYRWKRKK